MKALVFFLALIGGLAGYWFFIAPKDVHVNFCNTTIYNVSYALIEQNEGQVRYLNSSKNYMADLPPGQCHTSEIEVSKEGAGLHYYASIKSPDGNWRGNDQSLFNYVNGLPGNSNKSVYWEGNNGYLCLPRSYNKLRPVGRRTSCQGKRVKPISRYVSRDEELLDGNYFILLSTPNLITLNALDYDKPKILRKAAWQNVNRLRSIYSGHIAFNQKWRGQQVPLHLGARLIDSNGPLSSGVTVSNPQQISIFGDRLPLQEGDAILKMNETDIYAPADVFQALINHGFSTKLGITEPVKILYERRGTVKAAYTSYFYNERYHRFNYDTRSDAIYYGVMDALSFGLAAEATCTGKNTPAFVANMLYGLSEILDKSKKQPRAKYIDFDKCVWHSENEIALAQQTNRKLYTDSAWLTLFTPNAPRLLLQKGVKKGITKKVGSQLVGKMTATVALEMTETAIFFYNDRSPLQNLAQVADEYATSLPYIAGVTAVIGIISRK